MKAKMETRLYKQVYFYFVLILMFFAFFVGSIFFRLYEDKTESNYFNMLKNQGTIISERISHYLITNSVDDYDMYLSMLSDSLNSDVWIFGNNEYAYSMPKEYQNIWLEEEEISDEVSKVLRAALNGESSSEKGYSEVHQMLTMTVGVPIYNKNHTIAGALLLIEPYEEEDSSLRAIVLILVLSLLTGLMVSILLAAIFTRKLSHPISKINRTALLLSEGKYDQRTQIHRNDEIGQLASSMDILANRLMQNEMEQKQELQRRMDFFSNVSHEMRTPITVIRAYLETLVDGVVTEKEQVDAYCKRMLQECTGIQRLLQDLLLLSKMEATDFKIEMEILNVNQIFEDILRNLRMVNPKKIQFIFEKDADYILMNGDYDRLRQMFVAVIDNAIKFSEMESPVCIKVTSKDKIRVVIKDEGIGIEQEDINYIFDKFYSRKSDNNKNGTGLGLVIAKQIAEKHHGIIKVVSRNPVGTTFIFEFDKIPVTQECLTQNDN